MIVDGQSQYFEQLELLKSYRQNCLHRLGGSSRFQVWLRKNCGTTDSNFHQQRMQSRTAALLFDNNNACILKQNTNTARLCRFVFKSGSGNIHTSPMEGYWKFQEGGGVGGLEVQISKGCRGEKSNIFPEGSRALPDISERTFQDNDLFLRSMHEHVLRTHFQELLLLCESRFFSKMVKFGPNNRIKTTLISFITVTLFFIRCFKIILPTSPKAEATRSIISNCVQPNYNNKSQMI